jgi:hypothetical protein
MVIRSAKTKARPASNSNAVAASSSSGAPMSGEASLTGRDQSG